MLTVLCPMAGSGLRFVQAGITAPKPLIPVDGLPMVVRAVQPVLGAGIGPISLVFVIRDPYTANKEVTNVVWENWPGCRIVTAGQTAGAACSALLARHLIDNSDPLLILNCDQIVHPDSVKALCDQPNDVAAAVLTMPGDGSKKWSYAEVEGGLVRRVAEKDPISDRATCGLYWFARGHEFVGAAERMITADDRTNGEFYVCPTLNHLPNGSVIREVRVEDHGNVFHGLGTPEDLDRYLSSVDKLSTQGSS